MSEPIARILYVEDDPLLCRLFRKVVEEYGYAADTVQTGADAVAAHAAVPYDIVAVDYKLPDMPGLEVVRNLRKSDPDLPVFVVTGSGSEKVAAEALALGVTNYIIKEDERTYLEMIPGVIKNLLMQDSRNREKSATEAKLRQSEQRARDFAEIGSDWQWELDRDLRYTMLTPSAAARARYGEFDHIGQLRTELKPPDMDDADWQAHVEDLMARRPIRGFIQPRPAPNGGTIWMLMNAKPIFDDKGVFTGYRGSTRDITAQREAELELKAAHDELEERVAERTRELRDEIAVRERAEVQLAEKESVLRTALEHMSGGMFMFSPDMNIEVMSPSFATIYDVPEDLCQEGQSALPILHYRATRGDYGPGDPEHLVTKRLEGYRDSAEIVFDSVPGGRTIELFRRPMEDGGVVSVFSDITDRLKAERNVLESEQRYATIVDHIADSVFIHDFDGRIVEVNSRACENLGYTRNELLNMTVADIEQAVPLEKILATWRATEPGQLREFKGRHRRKDGEEFSADVRGEIIDVAGEKRILVSARDISAAEAAEAARAEAEANLVQADKLATLGRMAAGITHELSQPLNIIRLAAQTSLIDLHADTVSGDVTESIKTIDNQITRMAEIIDHMRIFARKDSATREDFSPTDCVNAALNFMSQQFAAAGIEIDQDIAVLSGTVSGAPVQLEQVLFNLLSNAGDAVATRAEEAATQGEEFMANITVAVSEDTPAETITIGVADNGGGISDDALNHVFEPFYTTKEVGSGTGLGLSVSSTIIESMGGTLSVKNADEGAVFTITLPRSAPAAPAQEQDPVSKNDAEPAAKNGRGTVLIVEDESDAGGFVAKRLGKAGFDTLTATNGSEALDMFRSRAIDLIITDLQMPVMDGPTLIRKIRETSPNLPIIVTTGRLPDVSDGSIGADGATTVFRKPIDLKAIVSAVEEMT